MRTSLARLVVRQRRQQHRVHDAEHRRGPADAERQRRDHHGGESGRPANLPQCVAQILRQSVDPAPPVHQPDFFAMPGKVAELSSGGHHRVVWRHPLSPVPLGEQFHVRVHLRTRLCLNSSATFQPHRRLTTGRPCAAAGR
jgi:hypothetical protein